MALLARLQAAARLVGPLTDPAVGDVQAQAVAEQLSRETLDAVSVYVFPTPPPSLHFYILIWVMPCRV